MRFDSRREIGMKVKLHGISKMLALTLLLLTVSTLIAPLSYAQSSDGDKKVPSWEQFLIYLSTPTGVSVSVGLLASLLAEYIPAFEWLDARLKRLIFLGFNLLVPVGAAALGELTAGWSPAWDVTWWPAIVAGWVSFGAGTALHTRKLLV